MLWLVLGFRRRSFFFCGFPFPPFGRRRFDVLRAFPCFAAPAAGFMLRRRPLLLLSATVEEDDGMVSAIANGVRR